MEINLWYDEEMQVHVCETPDKSIVGVGLTSEEAVREFKKRECVKLMIKDIAYKVNKMAEEVKFTL
jgi:hypothetical protein